ncbi:hypothetical protein NP233_g1186 [Leucocoprinus birnbaumii]|uniref:DUF6534 domain-containing protein n=1 Tax=Leucocoprinus birnbaumii TaxID=56174 RepID=A0AAD5W1H8_9AGAR|nr:hypothetical protein NP233_g1186 [Leucocoprinus birnbaumii]
MSASSPPLENPIILNIMPSYGSLLVGGFLSQAVWGVSTLQVFFYFQNFEHDKNLLKWLVVGLWLTDTANQVLLMRTVFPVLILQYGRIAGLTESIVDTQVHTLLAAVVVFIVQFYFIRRIFLFGRKLIWIKALSALLTGLTTWQLVGPIVYWSKVWGKPLVEQTKPFYEDLNLSIRSAAFVVDVTVALCMIWLLSYGQGTVLRQCIGSTKQMIFRIFVVTINSGTWTALLALLIIILLKVFPLDLYFCILEFPQCSLYFSTFMANLNSRNYIKGEGGVQTLTLGSNHGAPGRSTTLVLSPMRFPNASSTGGNTLSSTPPQVSISKKTETYLEPEYTVVDKD